MSHSQTHQHSKTSHCEDVWFLARHCSSLDRIAHRIFCSHMQHVGTSSDPNFEQLHFSCICSDLKISFQHHCIIFCKIFNAYQLEPKRIKGFPFLRSRNPMLMGPFPFTYFSRLHHCRFSSDVGPTWVALRLIGTYIPCILLNILRLGIKLNISHTAPNIVCIC